MKNNFWRKVYCYCRFSSNLTKSYCEDVESQLRSSLKFDLTVRSTVSWEHQWNFTFCWPSIDTIVDLNRKASAEMHLIWNSMRKEKQNLFLDSIVEERKKQHSKWILSCEKMQNGIGSSVNCKFAKNLIKQLIRVSLWLIRHRSNRSFSFQKTFKCSNSKKKDFLWKQFLLTYFECWCEEKVYFIGNWTWVSVENLMNQVNVDVRHTSTVDRSSRPMSHRLNHRQRFFSRKNSRDENQFSRKNSWRK